mmetsp:Transcript_56651/g.137656  ORF Transcript_56651/g.137656 Transcript_56651/m.137656 type:complete len:855 (-) Transcript_56651:2968-5532(-)
MSSSPFDPLDPLGGGDGGLGAFISSSGLIGVGTNTNGNTQFSNNGSSNVGGGGNVSAVSSQSTLMNSNNMNMLMPMGMAGGMIGGGPGDSMNIGPVSGGLNMGMQHGMGMGMGMMNQMGVGLAGDSSFFCRCQRCGYGSADLQLVGCGCSFHTRCLVIPNNNSNNNNADSEESPLQTCPACSRPSSGVELLPMSFEEIDNARKEAQNDTKSKKNGNSRKRKGAPGTNDGSSISSKSNGGSSSSNGNTSAAGTTTTGGIADAVVDVGLGYVSEKRTGRWSNEEMALCDKLIAKFESGELPIGGNIKLNEFLGNMLKSKQSRLTKKMKNAKLSSRTFQRTTGTIIDDNEARLFSELEDAFFQSLADAQQRAEIRFHMQREWREHFSQYCVSIGQALDADEWLSSVEEMDRRSSQAKDAARMAKRKVMMGLALRADRRNPESGVFIESSELDELLTFDMPSDPDDDFDERKEVLQLLADEAKNTTGSHDINGKSSLLHSAPFLAKTVAYLQRHNVPFEHLDVWVPSFVPNGDVDTSPNSCRLCFAGSATLDDVVNPDGKSKKPIPEEEQFKMYAFGDYSQKFSFDVGCGLPGRVYESGRPTWEQSVHNAPHHHFERCGGARQWGIKTVLGIPIASPNVGRIVVTFYSKHDRPKDQDLVGRLSEELTRLLPSPKWKLVVDVGEQEVPQAEPEAPVNSCQDAVASGTNASGEGVNRDHRVDEVVGILGELMPSDPNSALAPYLSGFMSLRLLLLRPSKSPEEEGRARTMLDSYTSYSQSGRTKADIGMMLARDYMYMTKSNFNGNSQQSQQANFFNLGQGVATNNAPAPSLSGNIEFEGNSPLLGPLPMSDGTMSIVSN